LSGFVINGSDRSNRPRIDRLDACSAAGFHATVGSAKHHLTSMKTLPRIWALIANFLLPVLLAWLLVSLVYRRAAHLQAQGSPSPLSVLGPVRLRLKLPGTAGGIPEPLLVSGTPGNASLVYIRLLKRARARVGVEFWGLGENEGDTFDLPSADAQIDVICTLPAFFPPIGNRQWGATPTSAQIRYTTQYEVRVDGIVRLKGTTDYKEPVHSPVYFGNNPLGGSLVSVRFTGDILKTSSVEPSDRD
jgi:hypothetical protein